MWYPNKASFRAGHVGGTQWDDANIGYFSTAFGQDARANGDYGFAAGNAATAAGTSSVALGEAVTASGAASVALGYGAHTNARQGSFVFADRSVSYNDSNGYFRASVNHSPPTGACRRLPHFHFQQSQHRGHHPIRRLDEQLGASQCCYPQPARAPTSRLPASGWIIPAAISKPISPQLMRARFCKRSCVCRFKRGATRRTRRTYRHIGAMAQDFHQAFRVGADAEHLPAVDTAGVAFAAIQGLHEELKDRDPNNQKFANANRAAAATAQRIKTTRLRAQT